MNNQPSTTIHIPKYISTSCQLHLWLHVGMFLGLIIWYLDRGKRNLSSRTVRISESILKDSQQLECLSRYLQEK